MNFVCMLYWRVKVLKNKAKMTLLVWSNGGVLPPVECNFVGGIAGKKQTTLYGVVFRTSIGNARKRE